MKINKKVRLQGNGRDIMLIRNANQSDFESLISLNIDLQRHVERSNPHLWRLNEKGKEVMRKDVSEMLNRAESLVIVAQIEETLIGFAIGSIQDHPQYTPQKSGKIEKIFIKREWRQKGVGFQFVLTLFQFFQKNEVREITLRYARGNNEGEKFWNSLGFTPIISTANIQLKQLKEKLDQKQES